MSKEKKPKFLQNLTLSHKEITEKRGTELFEDTKFEQEELVRKLESKKRGLQRELSKLEDIYPNHTTSLKFDENFKPKSWVEEVQSIKSQLRVVNDELESAKETMSEWFEV